MPLLGCVADDFTGATDLASMLVRHGMRTVQVIGVPEGPLPEADAVVVALKSRTAPVADAVAQSLAACEALLAGGARQILFKVCSTFDSTAEGNIGPVADALARRLGAGLVPVCPALPANGRTVYQGHLFVGRALLSESGMQDHPLTPMRDPDLLRVLSAQTEGAVGHLPYALAEAGAGALRREMSRLSEQGKRYAIADAVRDEHLLALGEASAALPLLVGGSGIAMGLPANFRAAGLLPDRADAGALPPASGRAAVVAGSCSRATLAQLGLAREHLPVLDLDPLAMPDPDALAEAALSWAARHLSEERPLVVAASAPPERVAALQKRLGREAAGELIERALAAVAAGLVARGVRRLVVAGGETSGAVVQRLGVTRLTIGSEVDPGVPWTWAERSEGEGLHLALKSGNFGGRDFFPRAFEALGRD